MCCIGRTVFIKCLVSISMVGHDQNIIPVIARCPDYIPCALINSLYSFFNSFINTCVSNHIAIRIIQAYEIEFFCFYSLNNCISHGISTHFRLQVVCCNFW